MKTPVIATLPHNSVPTGRSRLVMFLDGDTNNTDQGNVIDEDFFDNAYTYGDYLEDVQHRCALLDRVAVLEQALAQRAGREA